MTKPGKKKLSVECVRCGASIDGFEPKLLADVGGKCIDCLMGEMLLPGESANKPVNKSLALNYSALPPGGTNMTEAQQLAHVATDPAIQAAVNLHLLSNHKGSDGEKPDIAALVEVVHRRAQSLIKSDSLDGVVELLVAQIMSLDAVHNNMLRRAAQATTLKTVELYSRLATKAQAQCRMSIETLVGIKQPIFRQTNIANGPQQVNNHVAKKETEISLSSVGSDSPLETVAS